MIEFKTVNGVVHIHKDGDEVMRLYNMKCAREVDYHPIIISAGKRYLTGDDLRIIADELDRLNGFLPL